MKNGFINLIFALVFLAGGVYAETHTNVKFAFFDTPYTAKVVIGIGSVLTLLAISQIIRAMGSKPPPPEDD